MPLFLYGFCKVAGEKSSPPAPSPENAKPAFSGEGESPAQAEIRASKGSRAPWILTPERRFKALAGYAKDKWIKKLFNTCNTRTNDLY
jgi:hypothetical protein